MFRGKSLIYFTNLFSPLNFQKNDQVILDYFFNIKYENEYESHVYAAKKLHCNQNTLQFRLNRIKEIEELFIVEDNGREKMSRKLNKYIKTFNHADKTLLDLLGAKNGVSPPSFSTAIDVPVGILRASVSLAFLLSHGILKCFL